MSQADNQTAVVASSVQLYRSFVMLDRRTAAVAFEVDVMLKDVQNLYRLYTEQTRRAKRMETRMDRLEEKQKLLVSIFRHLEGMFFLV